jgi:hypothetical protein
MLQQMVYTSNTCIKRHHDSDKHTDTYTHIKTPGNAAAKLFWNIKKKAYEGNIKINKQTKTEQ